MQLGPRRYAPYVRPDLVANLPMESIIAAVLGRGAWLGFYNGNVNCPGSTFQPLHMDRPFSWKTPEEAALAGQSWPPPTTSLGCSIAVEAITIENGATEVYPGTHRATEVIDLPRGSRLEDHPDLLARWGPPVRMTILRVARSSAIRACGIAACRILETGLGRWSRSPTTRDWASIGAGAW